MKKIISFILTMIMLLTCTSISVMASDVQSDTADQDEKMTIGVSVYNLKSFAYDISVDLPAGYL